MASAATPWDNWQSLHGRRELYCTFNSVIAFQGVWKSFSGPLSPSVYLLGVLVGEAGLWVFSLCTPQRCQVIEAE